MTTARPFSARVVRQEAAHRTVTAMSDAQDESGVDLYRVAVDPAAYAESEPALYVYRQSRDGASYLGVVCDLSVPAIADGRVRGHEAVHQLRVDALVWHHGRSDGPPALVTLLHREGPAFSRVVDRVQQTEPLLDFPGPHGLRQTLWRVPTSGGDPDGAALAAELAAAELYIADGHHRSAAALEEWRVAGKPPEAGLLGVVHAMEGLRLSAFHRRVSGPLDAAQVLLLLGEVCDVREVDGPPVPAVGSIGVYVAARWYAVRLPEERPAGAAGLDVSILQSHVLDRLAPTVSGRVRTVDTVPDGTPLEELVARCDVDAGALFTLAPPPPSALTEVADAGEVMPPKTTYFEPKPATGIFLRR